MSPRRPPALRTVVNLTAAAGCTLAALSCAGADRSRAAAGDREPAVVVPPEAKAAPAGEIFPHVRIVGGAVEVDGIVPIDCHHPDTPHVFLEVVACAPDTREHEALVMTRARPSEVHAALLLVGAEPGAPGAWIWEGGAEPKLRYSPPRGDRIDVFVRTVRDDGSVDERPVREWIVDVNSGERPPEAPFRFAGSRFVQFRGREVYDADHAGNIVGLATFGNEVVAWTEVFSPQADIDEPRWIADPAAVPVFGTPATLVLRPVRE